MPFESLHFRYPWRNYQARVLDSTTLYLADRRLHIVAAPGSGKTTLGLEIFRRLGKPALVLSPTRIIRNQWIERLRDYCPTDQPFPPPWTSRSLENPGILTSITYQALHTKYRQETELQTEVINEEEISALIESIRTAGIETLILDEAHHLRSEWWKALSQVVNAIGGMTVVSLTATPPYGSNFQEWKRYEELCGVIDEEISVPELVKAGTLCPHQDFVWTVVPTEYERTFLDEYQRNVTQITEQLFHDEKLQNAFENHTWCTPSDSLADEVFAQPDLAIGLLVYFKGKQLALPVHLLDLLDFDERDIPELGEFWWQQLIAAYLYHVPGWPDDSSFADHRKKLARALRDKNLLRNKELQLSDSRLVKRHMTQSSAKIQACVDIYRHEREFRGAELRQVILTDFIRDEGVRSSSEQQVDTLGAWPIFRALANQLPDNEQQTCALLTGRLVVLHESVAERIRDEATFRRLDHLDGFVLLDSTSRNPVSILTDLLQSGHINVLVGTRALLGEGWDAPCINSLILASNVGSYMLTNQMRGRAIRVDKNNPQKASSIWHIVAIVIDRKMFDPAQQRELFRPGLADFRELESRFATFVGIHANEARIENNLLRLELPYFRKTRDHVSGAEHLALRKRFFNAGAKLESTNTVMVERLIQLESLNQRWDDALASTDAGLVAPSVSPAKPPSARMFHLERTLFYFVLVAISSFMIAAAVAQTITTEVGVIFAVGLIWSLPKFFVAARLLFGHLPVDGTVHQIGLAVRDTLCATRIIDNSSARLKVKSVTVEGEVYVNLDGGTFHDKSVFADCMEEIFGPIESPRYLLIRHGATLGLRRKDYHAVPSRIGVKKEYATVFHQAWLRYVGKADLLYTRTTENRKTLLAARAKSFSSAAKKAAKRVDRWV